MLIHFLFNDCSFLPANVAKNAYHSHSFLPTNVAKNAYHSHSFLPANVAKNAYHPHSFSDMSDRSNVCTNDVNVAQTLTVKSAIVKLMNSRFMGFV